MTIFASDETLKEWIAAHPRATRTRKDRLEVQVLWSNTIEEREGTVVAKAFRFERLATPVALASWYVVEFGNWSAANNLATEATEQLRVATSLSVYPELLAELQHLKAGAEHLVAFASADPPAGQKSSVSLTQQDAIATGSHLGRLGQGILKLYPPLLARLDAAAMLLPGEILREAFASSASDARRIYESLLGA